MSKKTKAKPGRKKEAVNINPLILGIAKKEFAREDISNCEAMRNVAKRFAKAPRRELEAVLVGVMKFNVGTVRRQIQDGRA